jgi:hypothetical protein
LFIHSLLSALQKSRRSRYQQSPCSAVVSRARRACNRQVTTQKPSSRGLLLSFTYLHRQPNPGQHLDFVFIFDHLHQLPILHLQHAVHVLAHFPENRQQAIIQSQQVYEESFNSMFALLAKTKAISISLIIIVVIFLFLVFLNSKPYLGFWLTNFGIISSAILEWQE